MVTTRSLFGVRPGVRVRRARRHAGAAAGTPWWPVALLLAVFWMHGLGVESGTGHVDVGTAALATVATAEHTGALAPHVPAPEHRPQPQDPDEHTAHPGGVCLSGQPEDGPALGSPGPAAPGTGSSADAPRPGPAACAPSAARADTAPPPRVTALRI
ncbi:hypothetical protein [Streptomyces sp. TRM64462]|uniref:hypothetical protein n=1 Tax=Streptomyces sp. TRM64462 TaxID=2741726 RepID=UPI001586E15C|nr:hypothetical protein [Streptomyces sp. TRM64462]